MGLLTNNPTYVYNKASNASINEVDQHNGMYEPLPDKIRVIHVSKRGNRKAIPKYSVTSNTQIPQQ